MSMGIFRSSQSVVEKILKILSAYKKMLNDFLLSFSQLGRCDQNPLVLRLWFWLTLLDSIGGEGKKHFSYSGIQCYFLPVSYIFGVELIFDD